MLCCEIAEGYLYYAEVRRRTKVILTLELRARVEAMFENASSVCARIHTARQEAPGLQNVPS